MYPLIKIKIKIKTKKFKINFDSLLFLSDNIFTTIKKIILKDQ